jgi:hypothetical protein
VTHAKPPDFPAVLVNYEKGDPGMTPRTDFVTLQEVLTKTLAKEPTERQSELCEILANAGKLRSVGDFVRGAGTSLSFSIGETSYVITRTSCSLKVKGKPKCLLTREVLFKITKRDARMAIMESLFLENDEDGEDD